MPFQPSLTLLRDSMLFGTALLGAFLAALWVSLVFWTYRDMRQRSQDRLLQTLAALVVLVLGPLGLIVYILLRPPRTLEDAYQHALEEEALLSEIEARTACPGCGARTRPRMADMPGLSDETPPPLRQLQPAPRIELARVPVLRHPHHLPP